MKIKSENIFFRAEGFFNKGLISLFCILLACLLSFSSFSAEGRVAKSNSNFYYADETDSKKKITAVLNSYYLFGGKMTHRAIVFRSGLGFDVSANYQAAQNLQIGPGFGVFGIKDELFIPVFLSLNANFSESLPHYFFSFKIGYSYAISSKYASSLLYDYKGGLFVEPGINYRFSLSDNAKFNVGVKLINQFGSLTYHEKVIPEKYKERLNFFLPSISFGIEM